jgi:hypothetical protein
MFWLNTSPDGADGDSSGADTASVWIEQAAGLKAIICNAARHGLALELFASGRADGDALLICLV